MNKKLKTSNRVDPVEVYCRIRPLTNENDESCLKILDDSNLMLQIPECSASYRNGQIKQLVYSFTQIYDDQTSQKQLFEQVALPLVQDLLNGKNGLLFTYGVTGSGKTYSMIGNQHESGMLQRSLDSLFQSIQSSQTKRNFFKPDKMNSFEIQSDAECQRLSNHHQSTKLNKQQQVFLNELQLTNKFQCQTNRDHYFSVYLSCIEIYNNYIYDLLDDQNTTSTPTSGQNSDLKESKNLKEDSKGCMYIKDVNEIEIKSTEEALELITKAQKKRVVAYTELNSESSRSHSIFSIRLVQSQCTSRQAPLFVSQLSLVDLAGSERTKRTKNTGSRLREAGSINSSLMALRNCMETLRENSLSGIRKMVPYRDSKLTLLFKNYFEGNGKIKMILCINPNSVEFDETSNVLKFSDLVRDVLVPASVEPNMNVNSNGRMPKSASVNSNLNFKITFDELENNNLAILNNLQQNNYSLMNENFPPLDIFSPDDDQTIKRIIDYLEEFQRRRDALIHETDLIKQQFYVKLRDINDELERIKEERNEIKSRLDFKEKEQAKFDNKIRALEKIINTNSNYRTPQLNRNYATPNNIVSSCSSTNNSGNTISSDKPVSSSSVANSSGGSTVGETPVRTRVANVNSAVKTNSQTPSGRVVGSILNSAAYNRYQTPAKNPVSKEGVPVANRRAARRSKSAEMWLDHKPPTVTKTDTVLQPKMQRKKSVSKVELNDAKKSSKYVLTHQQQDENGEIRTNLIKGDIIRSPSGGANIIFTDIETLETRQQEASRPLKRPFECDNLVEDRHIIEERCSIAIEGHSSFTKTRTIANI